MVLKEPPFLSINQYQWCSFGKVTLLFKKVTMTYSECLWFTLLPFILMCNLKQKVFLKGAFGYQNVYDVMITPFQ